MEEEEEEEWWWVECFNVEEQGLLRSVVVVIDVVENTAAAATPAAFAVTVRPPVEDVDVSAAKPERDRCLSSWLLGERPGKSRRFRYFADTVVIPSFSESLSPSEEEAR